MLDVTGLLESKNIDYVVRGGGEISIRCPNAINHQDGSDSIESFNINIDNLESHCFSCGLSMNTAKLTKWLLGEDLDELEYKCLELRGKLKKLQSYDFNIVTPVSKSVIIPFGKPVTEPFRNISVETYKKLNAVIVERGRYAGRLCFPIILDGKIIGIDGRLLNNADVTKENPKYKRNFNSSCQHDWLWPFDVTKNLIKEKGFNYVILGEGAFHAANGINHGFPTLTYFGANNFSQHKALMLMSLGITEVVVFPDKDKAGELVLYGNPTANSEILKMGICRFLSDWFEVSVANTDRLQLDPLATLAKQKAVYQDLGDLNREEIQWAIDNRRKF